MTILVEAAHPHRLRLPLLLVHKADGKIALLQKLAIGHVLLAASQRIGPQLQGIEAGLPEDVLGGCFLHRDEVLLVGAGRSGVLRCRHRRVYPVLPQLVGYTQLFRNGEHGLCVGFRLADGVDRLVLQHNQVVLTALGRGDDVALLVLRRDRQDDVAEERVVLHPGMLDQIELDRGIPQRILHAIAAVPARGPAGRVGPDHVDATRAGRRVLVGRELVLAGKAGHHSPVPRELLALRQHDGVGNERLGNEGLQIGSGHVPREARPHERAPLAVRNGVEALHAVDGPFHHLEHVAARSAHALHGEKGDLQSRRLVREHRADVAAAVAVHRRHVVGRPIPGKRLDVGRRHPAFRLGPFGRLRNSVLMTEHIVLEPVETVGVSFYVLAVVGSLHHPRVGDAQPQRRVGVGENGNPLIGVNGGAVIQIGTDVDLLDADLAPEVADLRCHLAAPAPGRCLGIAAHHEHGVGIFGDIPQQVGLVGLLPHRIHAPHVLGAPVPSFPAVGLARLQGESSEQVHEMGVAAVSPVHDLGLAVAVALHEHGGIAVGVDNAADLVGADLRRLIPADALISRNSSILGVALPIRIPVHALQRVRNAIAGIDALHVPNGQRRQGGCKAARQLVSPHLDSPGVDLIL